MFVLIANYLRPLDEVLAHRSVHREWVSGQYEAGRILVSGPLRPPPGGVIVLRAATRAEVEELLEDDPYIQMGLVRYDILEFEPTDFPIRSRAFDAFLAGDNVSA